MKSPNRFALRIFAALLCASVLLLSGCDGFWVDTKGGGGGDTGSGNYVYVANGGSNSVTGFSLSTAGALTAVNTSSYSLGYSPTSLAVSRSNKYLYVGTVAGIYGYSIASTTGKLSVLGGGKILGVGDVVWMDVSPDGNWLISLNGSLTASISVFRINSDGSLSANQTFLYSTITAAAVPHEIHITPNGAHVYATAGTGGTLLFNFNTSTGVLTVAGNGLMSPVNSLTSDISLAIDSNSQYLYLSRTGTAQGLTVYQISSAGALTKVGSTYTTGQQPNSVVFGDKGAYLYIANSVDSTISGYVVGSNGALTAAPGSPYTAGSGVTALAGDSTNKWMVAASYNGSPDVESFGFDSANAGAITSVGSAASGTQPSALALTH